MELTNPNYAVLFSSITTESDQGYMEMALQMELLAKRQTGFLGFESVRDHIGISASYWESLGARQIGKCRQIISLIKRKSGKNGQMV